MRLRFAPPPFLILFLCAILSGVFYYWWDNSSNPANPASPQPVLTQPAVAAQIASPAATPDNLLPTATIVPAVLTANRRQQITPGSTIFIPRASIYSQIVQAFLDGQSWDISQLRSNVGHLEGTSWVDQPGNVVLSGHIELSNGNPGIFANLPDLQISDLIIIETPDTEYRYSVVDIYRTVPQNLDPVRPTLSDRLTLITCGSYDFVSDVYQERIIVVAERM
jgi:LPXTG-site transpeptidase (sortase) family protein